MNRRNQNKRIVVDTLLDLIAGNVCISDARYLLMTLAHRWTACGYQVLQRLDERVRLSRPGPGLKSKTCARVDTGSEPLECLLRDTFGGAFCIVQHRVTRGDRHSARDVGAVRREWFACEPLQPFSNVFRHLPGGLLNRILQREIGLLLDLAYLSLRRLFLIALRASREREERGVRKHECILKSSAARTAS